MYVNANKNKVCAEYVWVSDHGLKSKARTLDRHVTCLEDVPEWQYAGGSGQDSETILRPQAVFRDPFRRENDVMVFCDRYKSDGTPHELNTRAPAKRIFDAIAPDLYPWFGMEQEYVMTHDGHIPLGFTKEDIEQSGKPLPQGPHYCGVGFKSLHGRQLAEAHYRACLDAGIKICGINAELLHGQWEFQIGICNGIEVGDHLWMARYLLERLGEQYDIIISYDPKPVEGEDWSASGLHTNFSTSEMRKNGGLRYIMDAVDRLQHSHQRAIQKYGEGNERRMTTKSMSEFTYGVADRSASVRISKEVFDSGKGYLEDRRPAANADPYVVASLITESVCLIPEEKETFENGHDHHMKRLRAVVTD
jgi:glutamine synthetase